MGLITHVEVSPCYNSGRESHGYMNKHGILTHSPYRRAGIQHKLTLTGIQYKHSSIDNLGVGCLFSSIKQY